MRVHFRGATRLAALSALWAAVAFAQSGGTPDFKDEGKLRLFLVAKAEKTVFPERCAECHKAEFAVWQGTAHATAYKDLHTKSAAKQIYGALKLSLIRRATDARTPACLQCHYTPMVGADGLRAQTGVSCESCHGPAKDWIGVHNDYGVKSADFQKAAALETEAHRQQRMASSRINGQVRPSDIYGVAANCFQCHTVPNEELVNVGGHSAGSAFELVSEIGKIRHNFLQSFLTGDGKTNAERPPERKRILYVVGRALDVEYSLRGIAVATKDDSYLQAMVGRHETAVEALLEIQETVAIPEVAQILKDIGPVALKANNHLALTKTADAVGVATRKFIDRADGKQLAGLDRLWGPSTPQPNNSPPKSLPAPAAPPGPPARAETATPPQPVSAPPTARPAPINPPPPPPAPNVPAGSNTGAVVSQGEARSGGSGGGAGVQGAILPRPPWRPQPTQKFDTIPCTTCHQHKPQTDWLKQDPHGDSANKFLKGGRDQVAIAEKYGLTPEEMLKGNQMCMACHGTFPGTLNARVRNGVDCQQCHGPGATYKEPHQDGNYAESIKPQQGLVDLKNALVRARTCASCHYVTDPRLLSAGHKSGVDFKLDVAVTKIKHWGPEFKGQAVDLSATALEAAYQSVIRDRGPVPSVRVVGGSDAAGPPPASPVRSVGGPAPSTGAPAGPVPGPGGEISPAGQTGTVVASPAKSAVASPPAKAVPSPSPKSADHPPAPPAVMSGQASVETTSPPSPPRVTGGPPSATPKPKSNDSVDEILKQLKKRLEELYSRVRVPGAR